VAPVLYCAAVYVLLSQLYVIIPPTGNRKLADICSSIIATDVSASRFNPKLFYWIFIPADITCLVLQATGGALSATGWTLEQVNVGVNITKAGLILQVVLLVLFLSLFLDYLFTLRKKQLAQTSNRTRIFICFLGLTVVFILTRCIYRIIELKDGYFAPNYRHQGAFIALEGAYVQDSASNPFMRSRG
jgi:hypothetical protein